MRRRGWLLAAVLGLAPHSTKAQPIVPGAALSGHSDPAWVATDPVGVPMPLVTLGLTRGVPYEIQTHNLRELPGFEGLTDPDTVVSLLGREGDERVTLFGADGCETDPDPVRAGDSCFRFELSAGGPPGYRSYEVLIRASRLGAFGVADLRLQRLEDASAPAIERDCVDDESVGCWQSLATDMSFGGLSVQDDGGAVTGPLHYETTLLPGKATHHTLAIAPVTSTRTPSGSWYLSVFGGAHEQGAPGTRQWQGLGGAHAHISERAVIVAGSHLASKAGPLRLMRNDRVTLPTATSGMDYDGDGLGAELEAVLMTCDSVDTPGRATLPCHELVGCNAPGSALCKASLRDSDQDGLRDNHEVYGTRYRGGALPFYGADPARYDVFVELDYFDYTGERDPAVDRCVELEDRPPLGRMPGRGGREPRVIARRYQEPQLLNVARVYRAIPGFENPNGSNGIAMHIDSGQAPTDDRETAFGDWGGSSIVDPDSTGYHDNVDNNRSWFFLHQKKDCYQGQTGPFSRSGSSGFIQALSHEIGHHGGLHHGGPAGSPTAAENGSPLYWSRISYSFQDYGSWNDATDPDVERVSYSDGRWKHLAFNPRRLDESCPFGRGVTRDELELFERFVPGERIRVNPAAPGCVAIDWNDDGVIAPAGSFVEAPIQFESPANGRPPGGFGLAFNGFGAVDLAQTDKHLFVAAPGTSEGAGRALEIRVNRGFDCVECPPAGEGFDKCWKEADPITHSAVLPPADTVAIAGQTKPGGAAVFVYGVGTSLAYGVIYGEEPRYQLRGIVPGARTHQIQLSLAEREALEANPNKAVIWREWYRTRAPDLVVDDDAFLLSYRTTAGHVVMQRGEYDANNRRVAWSRPVTVVDTATNEPVIPADATSPALGRLKGWVGVGDAVIMAVVTSGGLVLGRLEPTTARWTALTTVPQTESTGVVGRPSFAQVDYGNGSRLVATWLKATGSDERSAKIAETTYGTFDWYAPRSYLHKGHRTPATPPLLFDTRSETHKGLRTIVTTWTKCADDAGCTGPGARCEFQGPDQASG